MRLHTWRWRLQCADCPGVFVLSVSNINIDTVEVISTYAQNKDDGEILLLLFFRYLCIWTKRKLKFFIFPVSIF